MHTGVCSRSGLRGSAGLFGLADLQRDLDVVVVHVVRHGADLADYGKIYPVLKYLNKEMGLDSVDLAVGQPPEKK